MQTTVECIKLSLLDVFFNLYKYKTSAFVCTIT
jgi:hypothetical protein